MNNSNTINGPKANDIVSNEQAQLYMNKISESGIKSINIC